METKFQRKGALSNAHAGREFEGAAHLYFKKTGVVLQRNFEVSVGFRTTKLKRWRQEAEREINACDPGTSDSHVTLAVMLRELGREEEAKTHLQEALRARW
jgi:hypothetical protein